MSQPLPWQNKVTRSARGKGRNRAGMSKVDDAEDDRGEAGTGWASDEAAGDSGAEGAMEEGDSGRADGESGRSEAEDEGDGGMMGKDEEDRCGAGDVV